MRRVLPFLLLPALLGCTDDPRFNRTVDALNPWPEFGSSARLIAPDRSLAPSGALTVRRVLTAGDPDAVPDTALRTEPGDIWPGPAPRGATLADFERSLHDGTLPPPAPALGEPQVQPRGTTRALPGAPAGTEP